MYLGVSQAIVSAMGPQINVGVNVQDAVRSLRFLKGYSEEQMLQGLSDAVERSIMYVRGLWVRNASGTTVSFDGKNFKVNRITGQYVASIQNGLIYPMKGNPYWGRVESNCPYAIYIEAGRRARSGQEVRQKMLQSSKAKTAKDGSRYITIPFRHGTPGAVTMKAMPKDVYEKAKNLGRPMRIGGNLISGGSLNAPQIGRRTKITTPDRPFAPYTWRAGKYQGMKKMGKSGHSQYITFRRISSKTVAGNESWAQPAVSPRPVAQASARQALPHILEEIKRGLLEDMV